MLLEAEDYKNGMKLEKGVLYNGSNGTYRYADNQMYSAVIKVPTPYGGDELQEQIVSIKLPKIPYSMFDKIYEFFKYIYKKHKAEVAVLLWYNFNTKEWETEVPKQTVGGGSVNYTRDEEWANDMIQKGFICVGTIHSHCEMSAFHSGTDDHDEYNFDGVHITIGKVLSGPEFAQRFIVKTMSTKFNSISDVVDIPKEKTTKFPEFWDKKVNASFKSSIFGGGKRGRTVNMQFNRDGSLRIPQKSYAPTEEFEEEITASEKIKRASVHLLTDKNGKNVYLCPLCFQEHTFHELDKDFTCPECGFPLWDDEMDYEINSVPTKNGYSDMALKETEDSIIEDITENAINEDLKQFIEQDEKHSI